MSYLCLLITKIIFYEKSLSDVRIFGHNVKIQAIELKCIKPHLVTHVIRSLLELPLASGETILWLCTSKKETIEKWIEKSDVNNTD